MEFRPIFPLLFLALQVSLPAQDPGALMRKGDDALASGLWEMAALHFSDCLARPNLSSKEKSQAALRLAESWIRDDKSADALGLLGESFVSQDPEAPFWVGQALTKLGRFSEALTAFMPVFHNREALHRNEAGFTMASLQMALARPEAALATLAALAETPDKELTAKARLLEVEILLDLGRFAEARKQLPSAIQIRPSDRPLATFLEAQLWLCEGQPAKAAASFQTLVDQPQGQSLVRHHFAAIGLADALLAQGFSDTATNLLLSFIQEHPESPLLEEMFKRLLNELPDPPELTDPILERLAQCISPCELSAGGAINTLASNAVAAWPGPTTSGELLSFSLFTRAVGLHRIASPEAQTESRRLLTRLRLENPEHFLANRALFLTAQWALEQGSVDQAFSLLDTLRETAQSPKMRGEAAFLEARSAYSQGKKMQAIRLFEEAGKSLADNDAKTAQFNAAVIRLSDASTSTLPVLQSDAPPDKALTADLELERALCAANPVTSKTAIEGFLARYPDHPRASEARLAAAEAALTGPNPDSAFARAQLETITATPEKSIGLSPTRIALLKLRIDDLSNHPTAAIATAKSILEQYPGDPAADEAALVLGRNLFQTRSYNDARIVLQKLASSESDPARAQAAGLLAARAAALVPTRQSQQEALALFNKVIESKGSLGPIAILEKSRLMIDMNRLGEATATLRPWFDSLQKTDPLHFPAGLLLGEAIYAQGHINPHSLTDALAVYDQLLAHAKQTSTAFNRLQYLRGRTLEQILDEKDPSRKRDKEAFIAYYSVLETPTPPAEWHYFELCGFRALALLEKAGRWPAAIACAKKIASFHGPRAEESATRASQLQLKHMIWED